MSTFVNTLHVLAAVLVIGPLVLAPFLGQRAIRRGSEDGVRAAAKLLLWFGAGSVLVAGLGVGTVLATDEWTMATPWVLIASTLYVVALGLIGLYAVPALRKASHLVAEGADETPGASPDTAASAGKLQAISARVAGAGWLLLVTFAAITILMTARPFE